MLLANRERMWLIATVTLLGCMLGALVGYAVGFFAFETIGQWALDALNITEEFESARERLEENAFWLVIAVGVTPVPFQVATVGSGLVMYSLVPFLIAATIARSIRYYGLVLLVMLFGRRINDFIQQHRNEAKAGFWLLLAIAGGVAAFTYLQ